MKKYFRTTLINVVIYGLGFSTLLINDLYNKEGRIIVPYLLLCTFTVSLATSIINIYRFSEGQQSKTLLPIQIIKVRKPKRSKFLGLRKAYDKYLQNLPRDGDVIKIVWFPDNRGEKNAYIGMHGEVRFLDVVSGNFFLYCDGCILVCSGDFDYVKLINPSK